jgi:hypothetical protein
MYLDIIVSVVIGLVLAAILLRMLALFWPAFVVIAVLLVLRYAPTEQLTDWGLWAVGVSTIAVGWERLVRWSNDYNRRHRRS